MKTYKTNQDLNNNIKTANTFQIKCCYSEVNEKGKHITSCDNLPTKLDKDNIQIRYFCQEHMEIVKSIRIKMTEKYINEYKEKLIKLLEYRMSTYFHATPQKDSDRIVYFELYKELKLILEEIENGSIR